MKQKAHAFKRIKIKKLIQTNQKKEKTQSNKIRDKKRKFHKNTNEIQWIIRSCVENLYDE